MEAIQGIENKPMIKISDDSALAKELCQTVFDEWLLEKFTVKSVKEAISSKNSIRSKNSSYAITLTSGVILNRAKEIFGTHRIMFPSIGFFLFPRKDHDEIYQQLKTAKKLFKSKQFMVELKQGSKTLSTMLSVFRENGLQVDATINFFGDMKITFHENEGENQ